jgi:iron complex outermembrane recepter protein
MIERTARRGTTTGRKYSLRITNAVRMLSSLAGVVAVMTPAVPSWAAADLDQTINFHIASQPLDTALLEFSKQAQIQLAINAGSLRQIMAPKINGQKVAGAALTELLVDTGLGYGTVGHTVTVAPKRADGPAAEPTSTNHSERSAAAGAAPRISSDTGAAVSGKTTESDKPSSTEIPEVLVSAEKRSERLQDVPIPMTVVSSAALIETHQIRVEDYYTRVPGLSVSLLPPDGTPSVAIRGLTTGGATNPTVGLVIDDVPYGSTVTVGNYLTVTDIDPNDIAQIEVLRGPQGTLYGSSSIGGLLKITTIDPSTESLNGRVEVGSTGVHNGNGAGYDFRAGGNVPVGDAFAIRASGFVQQDPGYINNIRTGEDGVNERRSKGGRLGALWRPSDDITLKLSALVQDAKRNGSANVDVLPGLGDLQQNELPGTGGYERKSQAYGATLKAKVGGGELTSATGYSIDRLLNVQDDTSTFFSGVANALYGVSGAGNFGDETVNKFSQEVRLAMPLTQQLEWLVGAFYTHEKSGAVADFAALDPATGAQAGQIAVSATPEVKFREYAAFTDLTVHFTDRFDVQFGGRYSNNNLSYFSVRGGPLLGNVTTVSPQYSSKGSPLTYLVTPRFKLSPDMMVYARLASGYRPGVPNINCGLVTVPCQSDADTTQNYELGVKGDAFARILTFDASLYYIDWKKIQLPLATADGFGFTANEGRAKSQGLEISLESRPLTGLTLSAWTAWNDAELTESFPISSTVVGQSGDRLPYGSRFSGNFSANQQFLLWGDATGFVSGTVSYVGDRKGIFRGSDAGVALPRQDYPGYAQVDARIGTKFDTWTISAFLNNVTDRRGLIGGDVANFVPFAYNYIQPRTVGLSLLKTFDAGH